MLFQEVIQKFYNHFQGAHEIKATDRGTEMEKRQFEAVDQEIQANSREDERINRKNHAVDCEMDDTNPDSQGNRDGSKDKGSSDVGTEEPFQHSSLLHRP